MARVARRCGADAVHPGYGFLAEREDFAQPCADADIAFIGPTPSSIAAMGDKAEARSTVIKAGVPVVPGTDGAVSHEGMAREAALGIGYPVLIKAVAGGGGRIARLERPQPPLERPLSGGGPDERRHWHQACWKARNRRRP